MELVSVVIPNYNNEKYLKQCVESVLTQSYKNIECIVVDDGSEDNSIEVLSSFSDLRLKVLKKSNGGLSSARNEGIKHARGSYLAFLDADDYWGEKKIENQIKSFGNTNADAVFSNIYSVIGEKKVPHNYSKKKLNILDFINENPISGSGSSLIIKKNVIDSVGNFDLNLRSHEDIDYWYRIVSKGYKIEGISENDVFIRAHENNMSSNHVRMFYSGIHFLDKALNDFFLNKHFEVFSNKQILEAVSYKLNRLRWKARDAQRVDLIYFTYLYGVRIFGLRFVFQKLNFKDLRYDLVNFFLRSRFYKFRRIY
ncbi:MAG: glycosyltransferase family 2 protein, partial [Bacteroidota bacterium]